MELLQGDLLMAVTLRKDGRWAVYYRVPGEDGRSRIKWEYFGHGAEGEAAAIGRDHELGLQKRRPRIEHSGPSFLEVAQAYATDKSFNANSRKLLDTRLEANLLPHFGDSPAAQIRDQDVKAYVQKRRAAGVKDTTIRRELTDLKAIMSWAAQKKLVPHNPIRDYKKPKEEIPASLRPPTDEEVARIFAYASPHLLRALKLSWFLGLRPGAVELLRMTWQESVNWTSRTILVISAQKGGPRARSVPIHPAFEDELRAWEAADGGQGPLIHFRGRPVGSLKTTWRKTLERAGIRVLDKHGKVDKAKSRRLRMYDFRHRFVTAALERGADMKALSEVVGSRPETLMRFYQHVTRDVHRQTVEKIPEPPQPETTAQKTKKVVPIRRRASR